MLFLVQPGNKRVRGGSICGGRIWGNELLKANFADLMVAVNNDDSVDSWNPNKWIDNHHYLLHLWLSIILAERFGQVVDTHVLICGREFLGRDHQIACTNIGDISWISRMLMHHRKWWRWPMKVCKISVFINMHDSKDSQDFWSLAFKKIFRLFFGYILRGKQIHEFLSFRPEFSIFFNTYPYFQ